MCVRARLWGRAAADGCGDGFCVQMPKGPAKAPAPVPEHVLKKRKKQEAAAAEKAKKLVADKKASKDERRAILNKAAKYAKEYAAAANDVVEKRREAKKHGNFYMEPEPKLMLVVRIKGINAVDPKTKKILQLMRLRQVGAALACACALRCPCACPAQHFSARVRASRAGGAGDGGPSGTRSAAWLQARADSSSSGSTVWDRLGEKRVGSGGRHGLSLKSARSGHTAPGTKDCTFPSSVCRGVQSVLLGSALGGAGFMGRERLCSRPAGVSQRSGGRH